MFRCFTIVNTVFFLARAVQLFFIPGLFLITTHPVIAYFLNIHHFEFLGPQRLYFLRGRNVCFLPVWLCCLTPKVASFAKTTAVTMRVNGHLRLTQPPLVSGIL